MLKKLGFTMIELLVVIAVIGILAVALLSTLNPLEQIRKGRDTRTRTDASQIASALERYNASLGRFPWQATEAEVVDINLLDLKNGVIPAGDGCTISDCELINGTTGVLNQLTETSEVKSSFIDRLGAVSARDMYLYYDGDSTGSSVIVCYMPESNTFAREAFDRCKVGASAFSSDFVMAFDPGVGNQDSDNASTACPDANYTGSFLADDADELICLP